MQTMIDALYPGSILLDGVSKSATLVAAYIDHSANPDSYKQAVSRFPTKTPIKISVRGTVGAHVLDCEPSTGVTPAECVPWAVNSRKAGIEPTVYCNELSTSWGWYNVRQEFSKAGVTPPYYWVANYSRPPSIPVGAIGHQYGDLDANGHNTYDVSIMVDAWPSNSPQEDDMALTPEEHAMLKRLDDAWNGPILQGTINKANELASALQNTREIYNNLNADLAQDRQSNATLAKVLAQLTTLNTAITQLAQMGPGAPIPADFWTQVKAVVDDSLSHLQLTQS